MRSFNYLLTIFLLFGFLTSTQAQNDEKYYYKLGKKYLFTKDYETASKHFNKCMSLAEKNKNEDPNYYYYPLLMYYYGAGTLKQANKAAALITELMPPSPDVPTEKNTAKERKFNEFMKAYGIEIDRSDYIFLRYYIHFKKNAMDPVDAFDSMEFAVRYHGKKSLIDLQASYDLLKSVYQKEYEKDADPETSGAPFQLRLCTIFKKAVKQGSGQAEKVVAANCS